jgi:hypothetical protein
MFEGANGYQCNPGGGGVSGGGVGGGSTVIMTNISQKFIILHLGDYAVKNTISYKISVKNSRCSKITKCRGIFHFSTSNSNFANRQMLIF